MFKNKDYILSQFRLKKMSASKSDYISLERIDKTVYLPFTIYYLLFTVCYLLFTFCFLGCSKLKDNIPLAPVIGTHPEGWIDVNSEQFHGRHIAYYKWNMSVCKQCHGRDYRGGTSGSSCYTCHLTGPESCNLCHGSSQEIYPPKALNGSLSKSYIGVGAHNIHLSRDSSLRFTRQVRCVSCHIKVNRFDDPGHIGEDPDDIAEVVFDSLSITQTQNTIPNPVWNRISRTCSGTYCHGYFYNGNFELYLQNWTDSSGVTCGNCHGNPQGSPCPSGTHPQGFSRNQCYFCHSSTIDVNGQIINKSNHINGIINY